MKCLYVSHFLFSHTHQGSTEGNQVDPHGRVIALFCYLFKLMTNVFLIVNVDYLCLWEQIELQFIHLQYKRLDRIKMRLKFPRQRKDKQALEEEVCVTLILTYNMHYPHIGHMLFHCVPHSLRNGQTAGEAQNDKEETNQQDCRC